MGTPIFEHPSNEFATFCCPRPPWIASGPPAAPRRTPAGVLKTQAEFLRKIKAPAGTYTALPCLTNVHFVCLIHISSCPIHMYLYKIHTFLKSVFFQKYIQKAWRPITQICHFLDWGVWTCFSTVTRITRLSWEPSGAITPGTYMIWTFRTRWCAWRPLKVRYEIVFFARCL